MIKKFQRRKEAFTCDKCGEKVEGNGYTNHCPTCLWSKHVDINPGDRASNCLGLMEPVEIITKGDNYTIIHTCVTCGYSKKNKVAKNDSFEAILHLSSHCKK